MKAFLTRALVFAFPCVAVAQIAVLQIKVIEGEGATHPPGAHVSRPLIVQVTDESGQPVAGAAVSFQLPPEGASGVFVNGLRTDVDITDAAGHATIHAIQLNRTSGQLRIRITATKDKARAGVVSFQSISENAPAPVAPTSIAPVAPPAPEVTAAPAAPTAPAPPPEPSAERAAGPATEHSPGITATTTKMGTHISKKWIVIGVAAVVAGVAVLGISRATSSKSSSSGTNTTATIGTPTITIGNPNP